MQGAIHAMPVHANGVFEFGEAHLAHGWPGSGGDRYLGIFEICGVSIGSRTSVSDSVEFSGQLLYNIAFD